MNCQKCGKKLYTMETNNVNEYTLRIKKCKNCGEVVVTKEVVTEMEPKLATRYKSLERTGCTNCAYTNECDDEAKAMAKKEHYWCWIK